MVCATSWAREITEYLSYQLRPSFRQLSQLYYQSFLAELPHLPFVRRLVAKTEHIFLYAQVCLPMEIDVMLALHP